MKYTKRRLGNSTARGQAGLEALLGRDLEVQPRSDRMGVCLDAGEVGPGRAVASEREDRLSDRIIWNDVDERWCKARMRRKPQGAGAPRLEGGQQLSEACVSGTVQLPPDGDPRARSQCRFAPPLVLFIPDPRRY